MSNSTPISRSYEALADVGHYGADVDPERVVDYAVNYLPRVSIHDLMEDLISHGVKARRDFDANALVQVAAIKREIVVRTEK